MVTVASLPFSGSDLYPPSPQEIARSEQCALTVSLSGTLEGDLDSVRADLFDTGGSLYEGKLTHYPMSGFEAFEPPEDDGLVGHTCAHRPVASMNSSRLKACLTLHCNHGLGLSCLHRFDQRCHDRCPECVGVGCGFLVVQSLSGDDQIGTLLHYNLLSPDHRPGLDIDLFLHVRIPS
jgi:hypothetical protein